MHSNKPYETKSSTFQKKHFDKLRTFSTRVHLCIPQGGGHLKDIVHKKRNNVKQI